MMSKKQKIFLYIIVGLSYVEWSLLLSLLPPFYPSEAESKGCTSSQYGWVFGIANLAAFLMAPLCGKFGSKIGVKYLYNIGAFLQSSVGFAFGFLVYADNTIVFLSLSYILMFLNGFADVAAWTSIISILITLFPKNVASVLSWTEVLTGLGYILGPVIGSGLYSLGGFLLPFVVVGSIGIVLAVCLFFAIPKGEYENRKDLNESNTKKLTWAGVFKSPKICSSFVDNLICFMGTGMIESMLEPHLKDTAGASQTEIGITFMIYAIVYTVAGLGAGYLCDKTNYRTIVSCFGNIVMVVVCLFLGPAPFLNLSPKVGLIQGMAGLGGIGYAFVMVSTFSRAQAEVLKKGFSDDIETYLMISGLWSSSFYLGAFLGPSIAGFLVDAYGFEWTTVIFAIFYCVGIVFNVFELSYTCIVQKEGFWIKSEIDIKEV